MDPTAPALPYSHVKTGQNMGGSSGKKLLKGRRGRAGYVGGVASPKGQLLAQSQCLGHAGSSFLHHLQNFQPDCEATSQTSSRSDAAAGGHTVHVSAYARHMSNLAGSVFDMGEEGPQAPQGGGRLQTPEDPQGDHFIARARQGHVTIRLTFFTDDLHMQPIGRCRAVTRPNAPSFGGALALTGRFMLANDGACHPVLPLRHHQRQAQLRTAAEGQAGREEGGETQVEERVLRGPHEGWAAEAPDCLTQHLQNEIMLWTRSGRLEGVACPRPTSCLLLSPCTPLPVNLMLPMSARNMQSGGVRNHPAPHSYTRRELCSMIMGEFFAQGAFALWGPPIAGPAVCGCRNDLLAKLQAHQGLACHLLLKADARLHIHTR
ncbi:MAG: hypothetical protein FRX49_04806 [Trebouxia sp. A1-2]|nr:MAG: hypothetical protein FRX49_04806 [Trebouxia sp. A1-2]